MVDRITRPGFTLIEVLIVVAIIGVLAGIALNGMAPERSLQRTYDTSRVNGVLQTQNAARQYLIEHAVLAGLPAGKSAAKDVCRSSVPAETCAAAGGYDLSMVVPVYITELPVDPQETNAAVTGFRIYAEGVFIQVCSVRLDEECGA